MCGVRPDTNNCDGRGSAISLTAWLLYETLRERLPLEQTKQKTGRPGKLSLEDQLLMTLEYWSRAGDAPPPESTVPTFI